MKKLKTTVILGALFLSGCAAPTLSPRTAETATPAPSAGKAALVAQSREIRSKITERKQKIAVFEVMLTDVERRAARSQINLTYLPNTNVEPEVTTQRSDPDRLSVAVRPSPNAAPYETSMAAKPSMKKRLVRKSPAKKKKSRPKSSSVTGEQLAQDPKSRIRTTDNARQ